MHVTAWLYPKSDSSRDQLLRAIHPEEFQFVSARYGVRVGSPALERILEATDGADGLGVSAGAVLSKAELQSLPFREVMCRSTARESDRDYERNNAACTATPLQDFGAEEPIRLFQGISLSRVKIKPNFVAGVGEWTDEYVSAEAYSRSLQPPGSLATAWCR